MSNRVARDLSKLPRWAAQYIDKLERDVAWWKAAATVGTEDSDTFVEHGISDSQPLGKGTTVQFKTGLQRSDYVQVRNYGDGSVEIRTSWHPMLIMPSASNTIRVRQEETA